MCPCQRMASCCTLVFCLYLKKNPDRSPGKTNQGEIQHTIKIGSLLLNNNILSIRVVYVVYKRHSEHLGRPMASNRLCLNNPLVCRMAGLCVHVL